MRYTERGNIVASQDHECGQFEGNGTSPGTKPPDPYLTSRILSVFVALAGLAIKLIDWMIHD